MYQRIYRSYLEPKREGLSWKQRWKGQDGGLIACWEKGRDLRISEPDLAVRAKNGELPVLAWKGGIEKQTKKKMKYGTLFYLAQWQGLRGEDLDIDMDEEYEYVCSLTGIKTIFTHDVNKYGNA